MPVGSADRGVGLGAGEMMFTVDYHSQYIDWWHSEIPFPSSENPAEPYNHFGLLRSNIVNLGLTIGLDDWWNISLKQTIGERCMEWETAELSSHHRTECTSTDYDNAKGGYFGDIRINVKYLFKNQGKGPGSRIFFGTGLVIPSKNTVTKNPYYTVIGQDGEDKFLSHRHFYLSDGAYKVLSELQFYKKRKLYPVFVGGSLNFEFPLKENKYGYTPSKIYTLSLLALSGPLNKTPKKIKLTSVGLSLIVQYADKADWNGEEAPNSKSTMIVPAITFGIKSKAGSFGISLASPYIDNLSVNDGGTEQKSKQYQISISYRKALDKIIEKLYWK